VIISSAESDQNLTPKRRARVVVISGSYPPAFLMGGPVRSLAALTEQLSDEFDFFVITSAFDGPAEDKMSGVASDRWIHTAHATVWYFGAKRPSPWSLNRLIARSKPDVLYLNSLFNARYSIFPLMTTRLLHPRRRVLLAPRGELSLGALQIRAWKKTLYLVAFRAARLHRFVTWHASTEMEAADIDRVFGSREFGANGKLHRGGFGRTRGTRQPRVEVAQNLSAVQIAPENSGATPGTESIVYLSRIVPMKNLHTLLDAIADVAGELTLTVAGPAEDAGYWDRCRHIIASLPTDKRVEYVGPVEGHGVISFLSGFDLFILPTLGENFGHVVLEALAAGLPVIVGQDTPWGAIEEVGAGWTCDPRDPTALARRIEEFRSLTPAARQDMARSARRLADSMIQDPAAQEANRSLFRRMAGAPTK
jgi:glycosyltransferase involved in cell wall biosynthesis